MQTQNYDVSITPSKLSGDVLAPPSKSMSHRAVICAGLSESPSILDNIALSDDIIATLEAMKHFGAEVTQLTNKSLRIANPSLKTRI